MYFFIYLKHTSHFQHLHSTVLSDTQISSLPLFAYSLFEHLWCVQRAQGALMNGLARRPLCIHCFSAVRLFEIYAQRIKAKVSHFRFALYIAVAGWCVLSLYFLLFLLRSSAVLFLLVLRPGKQKHCVLFSEKSRKSSRFLVY